MMKGWRTLGVNAALLVIGLLQQTDLSQLIPMQYVGAVVAGIAAINIFLRSITNTPITKATA